MVFNLDSNPPQTKSFLVILVLGGMLAVAAAIWVLQTGPMMATDEGVDEESDVITVVPDHLAPLAGANLYITGAYSEELFTSHLFSIDLPRTLEEASRVVTIQQQSRTPMYNYQSATLTGGAYTVSRIEGEMTPTERVLTRAEGYQPTERLTDPLYLLQDVTLSQDGSLVAFSYHNDGELDIADLSGWNVAVDDFNGSEEFLVVIPEAARPQWVPNTSLLVYLREDGIYAFDTSTDTEFILFDLYQNLALHDGIAISHDGSRAVVTLPSVNAIGLLEIEMVEAGIRVTEVERVVNQGIEYVSPLFYEQRNDIFAVVARTVGRTEEEAEEVVEFRQFVDGDRLWTLSLQDLFPYSVTLQMLRGNY